MKQKRKSLLDHQEYHGYFELLQPKTLSMKNRNYDRKVRGSLEIDMAVVRYEQDKLLNRDLCALWELC